VSEGSALRILFVSAELLPLATSGGLGDAVTGLARALARRGHEVRCALPAHRSALARWHESAVSSLRPGGAVHVNLGAQHVAGGWLRGELEPGLGVELFDAPALFDRPDLYGYGDDDARFVAFSRAAAYRAESLRPDVVVAHDWHGALAICVLRTALDRGANRGIAAVQVVHNNAYQGRFASQSMSLTGLPAELFHPEGLEAWGTLCLLKGGIGWADRIVAVSPTYAQEIQTSEFGEGLEGAYRARAHRLVGIANGIDAELFDPAKDPALPAPFDASHPSGKAACREAALAELGLETPPDGQFAVAIGRFAEQKGWDVLASALDDLVVAGVTVGILGDGDPSIAATVVAAAARHPTRVAVRFGFDDLLARRLYAGSDAVLVPSRFEPCGLVQMIAQRYGAVPVAHRVGGLADTIVDPGTRELARGTGILFSPLGIEPLVEAAGRVATLARDGRLAAVRRRLMRLDVSWERPAAAWEKLLEAAAREARARI
jgi:starch synthase